MLWCNIILLYIIYLIWTNYSIICARAVLTQTLISYLDPHIEESNLFHKLHCFTIKVLLSVNVYSGRTATPSMTKDVLGASFQTPVGIKCWPCITTRFSNFSYVHNLCLITPRGILFFSLISVLQILFNHRYCGLPMHINDREMGTIWEGLGPKLAHVY